MRNKNYSVGNRLKKHRKIMGYTQSEVARLLGHKNTNRLCSWETGQMMPSVENLFKLSIIYRTLPDALFFDLRRKLHAELKEKIEKQA